VDFGTEIIFFSVLGGLILGPKRLNTMLGHVAQAKARFEETTRALRSQVAEELHNKPRESAPNCSPELSEDN
jgi:Sec-independent protein translocase protein TatA